MSSYQESLDYLLSLQLFGIKLGLTNISLLLSHFGNPQERLKVVHIGGTNGKGSTAAFLTSVLSAQGYRVGLFTSPHLEDFRERIRIGQALIPPEKVVQLTDRIKNKLSAAGSLLPLTFFEFVTAMALLYFAEEEVDLAVLEVGMGGRLDATNVVDPALAIITNVSLDHCQHLGNSLEEIAGEKLGIVKPGRPLVCGIEEQELRELVQAHCRRLGSSLFTLGTEFAVVAGPEGGFHYQGQFSSYSDLRLGLAGPHQITNAALCLAACEILSQSGWPVKEEAIRAGLLHVQWPGRLELFPGSPAVLLDCAHNPAGAMALRNALLKEYAYEDLILVLGIMADKDWPEMLSVLAPLAKEVIVTAPKLARSCPPHLLASEVSKYCSKVQVVDDVAQALNMGLKMAEPQDLVLVTGSIFTVSEARQAIAKSKG